MERRARTASLLLLLGLAIAWPRGARAWGPDGHVIVTRIAEQHLSPKARTALRPLLDGRSLPDVASWADDWRDGHPETAPWHFVDIPLGAAAYDAHRDCPGGNCAVQALEAQLVILRDRTAPLEMRKRALRLVVHLAADLHQPMHAATDDAAPGGSDRGGNTVKARLALTGQFPYHSSPTGNLHAIWDSDLIASAHRQQEAYVAALARLVANETHQVARDVAYRDLPPPDAGGVRQLGDDYAARCRPALEKQLQRAGLRLARLLNESF